jgi:DNA invertase Pin-like site-specific DNA recombinase
MLISKKEIMMHGKRIGYIRVSSADQNPDRQLEGIELDERFVEYASAKNVDRPKLKEMLIYARKNDHLFIHSIDRFARNLRDLQELVEKFLAKGVIISFIKENLTFDSENISSMSNFLLQIMGSLAEFERCITYERQMEGVRIARLKKKYKGRVPKFNAEQIIEIKKMYDLGIPKVKIAKHFGSSRFTVYKYLKNAQKLL